MLEDVTRPKLAWWTVGAVLAAVVGTALLAFTGTLVTALFLYYVCRPVYRRLRPRVGRNLAAVGSMVVLAIPFVLLVTYTVAIALQEVQTLAEEVDLGPLQSVVAPYFDASGVVQDPASLLGNPDFVTAVNVVLEGLASYLPLVLTFVLNLFIALAVTFYLLRDGGKLAGWVRHTFGHDTGVFDDYVRAVDEDLSSVYFGNILNALLAAIIAAITYYGLNLVAPPGGAIPYPALLGMLIGAASLIPVVGMKIVYPPIGLAMLARAVGGGDPLWFPVVFLVASAVIIDFIPDIVLRPYVSGRNLHVGLVMIAYIIGPVFFGWYGLFLGPLLLVLVFHFAGIVLPELLGDDPLRPTPAFTAATDSAEYFADDPPDSHGTEESGPRDDAVPGDDPPPGGDPPPGDDPAPGGGPDDSAGPQ